MRKEDTTDQESPAIVRKQSWANSFLIGTAASLVALLFVGLMGAGTTVLYLRAAAEAGPQRPLPTPVETLTVEMQEYVVETIDSFYRRS